MATSGGTSGLWKMRLKSRPFAFQWSIAWLLSRISVWPIISAKVRKPSAAMYSRTSSATKKKKLMTCSGLPWNRARSTGSCVATPTGQVLRWHLRIMMQPAAIKRRGGEAELVGAEQRADDHVTPGADAAVDLDGDAAAQAVEHEGLLGLGKADLPRASRHA